MLLAWRACQPLCRKPPRLLHFVRFGCNSSQLKAAIQSKVPEAQKQVKEFRKAHGKDPVGQVTVNMIYGGMRGIMGLICETSVLDPEEGIRFRGYSIPQCQNLLPHATDCDGEQPLPEGLFWLLCTGEIPSEDEVKSVSVEWAQRAELPVHISNFLNNVPPEVHPMSQLSAACTILNTESEFVKAYQKGVKKTAYWEYVYEDAMNLIAKLPVIAAKIYKNTFKGHESVGSIESEKDWSLNFCKLLGYSEPEFVELMRMYLTIHSDHEGGNVSAHTTHLVGSALSDPYLSYAAGMNGLAGPLHGLANQEVLLWLNELQKEVGNDITDEKVLKFVQNTLKSGRVVPGYGHAVLRKTDPRFLCQKDFAEKHLPDDPMFKIVMTVYNVVPPALQKLGKVQNPWPNVDAHSGVLLQHYGLTEMTYYTVLFGVSRALGVMASLIWSRILGLPIERPKSISTDKLLKQMSKGEENCS